MADRRGHTYSALRGGAVSTNRRLCRLKAFLSWTLEREYLTANSAQRVRKLREFERERRLEPGEEERLRTLTKDDWLWRLHRCRPGDWLWHRRAPQRPIQAAPMGSERAAPVEPDDEGPADTGTFRSRKSFEPCWSCSASIRMTRNSSPTRTFSATKSASV